MKQDASHAPLSNTSVEMMPGASRGQIADDDLRLLADSANDFAMIFTDPERNIVRWSAGAEHVLGWTEQEVISKSERDLIYTPEDKAANVAQQEQDTALKEGRADDDRWHMKKDGTRFWASGVIVPLYDPITGNLRGYGKVLRDMTASKRLEEKLQQANETLEARVAERTEALQTALAAQEASSRERQSLLHKIVLTQEEERRRISHELHDQTGQNLTGLALGVRALHPVVAYCPPEMKVSEQLDQLSAVAQELAQDIHRIAVDLRPTALDDMGLVLALQNYVEQWSQRTGIPVDFAVTGFGSERAPSTVETTVYRVVQEALTNVAKYAVTAGATQVAVVLQRRDNHIRATVEDDGPGFDMNEARRSGRLGLIGMRERAELLGGLVEIESSPGEGTTAFLSIPLATNKLPEAEQATK